MPARSQRSRRLAFIGTLLAIFLLVGFVSFPLFSGLVAPLIPQRIEDAVGAEMIKETASHAGFCNDAEGRDALEALATRLAANVPDHTFKIYVSSQEVVNAYAAPGGHVVVFAPIIAQAQGPNEVAGVVAHEMGHVVERHPGKGLVEAVGYGIFGLATPGDGENEQIAKELLTNHHSRGDELEADRVGVEMLNAAGMDSRGLFHFFQRLKGSGDDVPGAVEFMSSHPSGETRTENLKDLATEGEPALTDEQWEALRSICKTTGAPSPIVVGAQ